MRFLKTLQKKQSEESSDVGAIDNEAPQGRRGKHVGNLPPELFVERDLKSGTTKVPLDLQHDALNESGNSDLHAANIGAAETNGSHPNSAEERRLPEITINAELVNPRLVAITQPNSSYSEEYRNLRTNVLHKSQKQKLQSIVIASVGPSEGKSITALNLSWLLAQTSGVTALVVDGDLRMPSLADYLNIKTEIGLSEVLDGTVSLADSIIRLEPAGLHLLPGGRARNDVAELLSGAKFKEILHEVYEMFDYIIIDAPPLSVFTDAAVLINHADAGILVVRADHTNYKDIDRVLETLPRQKILGAVLNQSEDTLMRNSYYNYAYYKQNKQ